MSVCVCVIVRKESRAGASIKTTRERDNLTKIQRILIL